MSASYRTKDQVLRELQSEVEKSGKRVVYYQSSSGGRYYAYVRVAASNSGKRILATSGDSYRISSLFETELPRSMTRDNAIRILESLPQLPLHFETHAVVNGARVVVDDFSFTSRIDRIEVKVKKNKYTIHVSSLRTVILPPPPQENDETMDDHEACEHKDQSPNELTIQLLDALNADREFAWWKTQEGHNACGHILAKARHSRACLVKTSSNTFHLIDAGSLNSALLPPDATRQEIAEFIQNLPTLLSNFNIQVYLPSRYAKLLDEWRTVSKISFSTSSTFTVVDDKNKRHSNITVDNLRCTTDAELHVTEAQELKVKLQQLKRENADLQRSHSNTAAKLQKAQTKLDTLSRSISSKESALSRKETELQRERSESARRSSELRRKTSEISDLNGQVKRLERNVSAREQTIAEYGNRFSEMTREQGELRLEVTNKNSEIKRLNKNIDAYEGVEEELTEVRKKNKELHREKDVLRTELSKYKGSIALDNPINSINLVSKMENLRDQEHAFACDVLIEEMGWDVKDAYRLLFEVFMLSYEYFENRMNDIRTLLNMNEDSALSALFSGPLQFNYAKLMDKKGLEERFVTAFEKVLGDNVEHRDMKKYVVACGELCWVAVLRTVPAKMYFFPRIDEINEDELQLFDPSRFMDYDQLSGERFVVQYILPGVSRVDSDRPLGLPLVLTEGREEKSDSNEEEAGLPVDEMRSELAPIEDAMWLSKRRKTRKLFGQMKIKPENCDLVIGCAADGCDFIHASSFAEFLLAIDKHRLCCGEDEDHVGVKILRLVPHDEY